MIKLYFLDKVFLAFLIGLQSVRLSHATTRRELAEMLLNASSYDIGTAPDAHTNSPTDVTVQLYILALDSLSEISMDYSIHLYLRQTWNDKRLNFENLTDSFDRLELSKRIIDKVWIPDTYFVDEKTAVFHTVTVPNMLMHIYKNGTVKFSMRISMKLSCDFQLSHYPFDVQICPITIESYGYSTEYVKYKWEKINPIAFAPNLPMARFKLRREPKVKSYKRDYWQGGRFSCLEGKLHFIRRSGYYVIQIFGPSILIVMLSWVSFWLDPEASPARISLGILSVLNMTTASSVARSALPHVSYVKAIDVWMATCLFFVFAALLHFAFVNVLARRQKRRESEKKTDAPPGPGGSLINFRKRAIRIDKIARIVFPSCFAVFNVGFWIHYIAIGLH